MSKINNKSINKRTKMQRYKSYLLHLSILHYHQAIYQLGQYDVRCSSQVVGIDSCIFFLLSFHRHRNYPNQRLVNFSISTESY